MRAPRNLNLNRESRRPLRPCKNANGRGDLHARRTRYRTVEKNVANGIFAEACHHLPRDAPILFLESEVGTTSAYLTASGFTNLAIANYDERVCTTIRKKFPHVRVHQQYVGAFFRRATGQSFRGVWLDYCCTVAGNSDVKPRDDVNDMFRSGILRNGGVFACTFSRRGTVDAEKRAETMMTEAAQRHGYAISRTRVYAYRTVFLHVYRVEGRRSCLTGWLAFWKNFRKSASTDP